ncbi:MAG: nucleotidyltransferase domain-containing protein [Candidatus Asgardarchaeia archaeon]
MREGYLALRWKLLKHRENIIRFRPKKFEEFTKKLIKFFGDKATIILIGSRAKNTAKTYSDYDLLIVYRNVNEEEIYDAVRKFKDPDLPIDLIPINVKDFNLNDKMMGEILKDKKILHDGIGIFPQTVSN